MKPSHLSVSLAEERSFHVHIPQLPSQHKPNLYSFGSSNVATSSVNVAQRSSPSNRLMVETTMSSTPSSGRKVLRPLPAIPSPHAPQCPTSPRPVRPLPSPPCTSLPSASPPKPNSFDSERVGALTSLDSLPKRSTLRSHSHSLVAGALKPLPEDIEESQPSSIQGCQKSPEAQHRSDSLRRLPKLCPNRLHLRVDELILDDSDGWITSMNRTLPGRKILHLYDRLHGPAYVRAAIFMGNILEISEKVVEESQEKSEGETVRMECFQPPTDADFRSRFSRHWLREKQGRRSEEEDYQSILNTLRSL